MNPARLWRAVGAHNSAKQISACDCTVALSAMHAAVFTYVLNTYLNYTTWGTDYYFTYVTLPERSSGIGMGAQHSCPDLHVRLRNSD